jgi:hypothetical protein
MKQPVGLGIFVRWDSAKQNKIYIGDKVKITTPVQEHTFYREDHETEFPQTIEHTEVCGILVLWMSKGLMLKCSSRYYMKIGVGTKSPTIKRIWELL